LQAYFKGCANLARIITTGRFLGVLIERFRGIDVRVGAPAGVEVDDRKFRLGDGRLAGLRTGILRSSNECGN